MHTHTQAGVAVSAQAGGLLERACQIQTAVQSDGEPLIEAPDAMATRVAAQFDRPGRPSHDKHWPPLLRMLERLKPDYWQ